MEANSKKSSTDSSSVFFLQLSPKRKCVFLPFRRRLLTWTMPLLPLLFFVSQLPSSVFLSPVICSQLQAGHPSLCHEGVFAACQLSHPRLHPPADKSGSAPPPCAVMPLRCHWVAVFQSIPEIRSVFNGANGALSRGGRAGLAALPGKWSVSDYGDEGEVCVLSVCFQSKLQSQS